MAVSIYALIERTEAERFLQLGSLSAEEEILLDALINACSLEIESLCRTFLIIRGSGSPAVDAITEDHSGGVDGASLGGAKRLYLKHLPIASVTSIADDDGNTVPAADYTVVAAQGILEHDSTWPRPVGRWTVTYSAGRFVDTDSVSSDLKLAAKMLVGSRFTNRSPGTKSRVGDVSVEHSEQAIPNAVIALVGSYRVIDL